MNRSVIQKLTFKRKLNVSRIIVSENGVNAAILIIKNKCVHFNINRNIAIWD